MNPALSAPSPIIDGLDYIGNPLSYTQQQIKRLGLENNQNALADLLHSLSFLVSYNGSTATFNSYRREVERILQWCWLMQKCSLKDLRRPQIEEYLRFCQSPPKAWIGHKQVARFKNKQGVRIPNEDWRPFVIKESASLAQHAMPQKTLQALFAVLSTYFNYLQQEDYLSVNPIALIRQKSKFIQRHAYQEPIRRLSNLQCDYVLETINLMAKENPAEHERSLFVMNCLFAMYLRISELVADERSTPVMGDFQQDKDRNWWLRVVGKGNKLRLVTVSDEMLNALKRYRSFLGLSPLPYPGEQTPLVGKQKGRGSITSTRQIRYMVQNCFDAAYKRMQDAGLEDEAQALKVATVHWLRHTGISEDVRHRPKEHVKEDAGHASMATTERYIDTELRERHASGRHKTIKPQDED